MKRKVLPIKQYAYRRGRKVIKVRKHKRVYWTNPYPVYNRGANPTSEKLTDIDEGGVIEPSMAKEGRRGTRAKEYMYKKNLEEYKESIKQAKEQAGRDLSKLEKEELERAVEPGLERMVTVLDEEILAKKIDEFKDTKGKEPTEKELEKLKENVTKDIEKLEQQQEKDFQRAQEKGIGQMFRQDVQPPFIGRKDFVVGNEDFVQGKTPEERAQLAAKTLLKDAVELAGETTGKATAKKIVEDARATVGPDAPKLADDELLFEAKRVLKNIGSPVEPPAQERPVIPVTPDTMLTEQELKRRKEEEAKILSGFTLKTVKIPERVRKILLADKIKKFKSENNNREPTKAEKEVMKKEIEIMKFRKPELKTQEKRDSRENVIEIDKKIKELKEVKKRLGKEIGKPVYETKKLFETSIREPLDEAIQKLEKQREKFMGKIKRKGQQSESTKEAEGERISKVGKVQSKETAEKVKVKIQKPAKGSVESLLAADAKEEEKRKEKERQTLEERASRSKMMSNRKALKFDEYFSLLTDKNKPKRGDIYLGMEGVHKLNVLPNAIPDNLMKKFHDKTYPGTEMQRLPFNNDEDIIAIKPSREHTYSRELKGTMVDPEVLVKKMEKRKKELGIE